MELKKASKKKVKARIGLSGASGFGKTYSGLLLAYGITGDWTKIAVIDTENQSADLYSDLGEYNTLTLQPPYSPERYQEALEECENAGMEVIMIDSITHEWSGEGGCLDIHSQLGGQFHHWAKVTPRHNKFVQRILQSSCHIITTVRRKQDYDLQDNEKGKKEPVKVGTKEETKQGYEYELMINFEFINDKHLVKASKDRTKLFMDKPEFVITSDTGKKIIEWCESGVDEYKLALKELQDCNNLDCTKQIWSKYPQYHNVEEFKELAKKKNHEFNKDTGQSTNQG